MARSKTLGEDARRVSSRISVRAVKNVVTFSVKILKCIFPGKIDRKIATKNPLHASLPNFQTFITLNFWDRSRAKNTEPKGLLMVVSKRWFEFWGEGNPLPPFYLNLTPFYLS